MSEFDKAFLNRHGEIALLPILENWEKSRGIKHRTPISFDDRWQTFIKETSYALAA